MSFFNAAYWQPWVSALIPLLIFAILGWLYSIYKHNVHIIDSMWGLYFLITAIVVVALQPVFDLRSGFLLCLVVIWALRLSIYLAIRNWGKQEDYRYKQIRTNNQPYFWLKSLYLVFILQLFLAWVIAMPLVAGLQSGAAGLGWFDFLGFGIAVFGIGWEAIADYQLYRFKRDAANQGKVMDAGLWALSRHPNYFGEACIWWGFYLVALAAGGWWTLASPAIMTFLLLRVSGVSMLEKTIHERRPEYRHYMQTTSAFIPWPKKSAK
jgi:steroid 5-alpha reductase family enzyme